MLSGPGVWGLRLSRIEEEGEGYVDAFAGMCIYKTIALFLDHRVGEENGVSQDQSSQFPKSRLIRSKGDCCLTGDGLERR